MRWLVILACLLFAGCEAHEGYSATAYRDAAGELTVCGGHKIVKGNRHEYSGQECEALRLADIVQSGVFVYRCAKPLTIGQLIAFTDLAYNIGGTAFCSSRLSKESADGHLFASCRMLGKFVYAKGRKLNGLVSRRAYYLDICRNQLWPAPVI